MIIGTCYRLHTTYGVIALVLGMGSVGRAVMLKPYRIGYSSGGVGVGENNNNNNTSHNLAIILLKPTVVTSIWLLVAYIDSFLVFDVGSATNSSGMVDGMMEMMMMMGGGGTSSSRLFGGEDIMAGGYSGKRYITGLIPYFIEMVSAPSTQMYTMWYY